MFNLPALPKELQILVCNAAFDACFNNRTLIISYHQHQDGKLTERITDESNNARILARNLAMTSKLFLQAYETFFVPRIHYNYYVLGFRPTLLLFRYRLKNRILRKHQKHDHMVNVIYQWWGVGSFFVEAGLHQVRDGRLRHMVQYHRRLPSRARECVCKAEEAGRCHIEDECWVMVEESGGMLLDDTYVLI